MSPCSLTSHIVFVSLSSPLLSALCSWSRSFFFSRFGFGYSLLVFFLSPLLFLFFFPPIYMWFRVPSLGYACSFVRPCLVAFMGFFFFSRRPPYIIHRSLSSLYLISSLVVRSPVRPAYHLFSSISRRLGSLGDFHGISSIHPAAPVVPILIPNS